MQSPKKGVEMKKRSNPRPANKTKGMAKQVEKGKVRKII